MNFLDLILRLFGLGPRSKEPPRQPRPLSAERAQLVRSLEPSPYGLNSHCARTDYIRRFADIGIRWHRIDIDWHRIEPVRGEFDWRETDALTAAAVERNLSLLAVIAYTPAWATANVSEEAETRRARLPSDPSLYLDFVKTVVARYGKSLKAVSIWNEPNLTQFFRGTRDEYITKLLVPALRLIRQEAPQIVLAGPDLSSSPGAKPFEWLAQILDAAGDYLDVITHHQYDGRDTPQGRASEVVKLHDLIVQKGFADRALWITETGWMVKRREPVEWTHQAQQLAAMMTEMRQRKEWWTKTFWYDSHGVGWGLLEADGTPREGQSHPAFDSYAATIAADEQAGGTAV